MNITYIAPYSIGSTSHARGESLQALLPSAKITVIDTDIPLKNTSHLWRSIGWRWKFGPFIYNHNKYILDNLPAEPQDIIWVDKAVFIKPQTTILLRKKAKLLVHYTPDPAFAFHRSKLFFNSIPYYNALITTKSFEMDDYKAAVQGTNTKIILSTQGFLPSLHRSIVPFEQKSGVVFIGHYEKERAEVVKRILSSGIPVTLAGIKWEKFIRENQSPLIKYLGNGVFGEDYVKAISSGLFGWGTLSKWIPEKHTTRTFEIPACGTALLTEWNEEIAEFFNKDEVIFYHVIDEMIDKVRYYQNHLDELQFLTDKGRSAVLRKGFDYLSVMKKILRQIEIPCEN